MDIVFTNAEEHRMGKGTKQSRLGPRIRLQKGAYRSANEIAVTKLEQLMNIPEIKPEARRFYTELMLEAGQTRFMNMRLLTQVIVFIEQNGVDPDPTRLSYDNIYRYIDKLFIYAEKNDRTITGVERQIARLRLTAGFLRYFQYVTSLRARQ